MPEDSPKEAQIKEQYDNTEPSGKAEQDAIKEAPDWLDELLIPDDNCLKIPGEHCGSCLRDFEDDNYSDMNCCDHRKWRDEAKAAITQHIAEPIDHSINVRGEKDPIEAFNLFIKKWCGKSYPHLIDSDENDGEFIREKIAEQVEAEKVKLLERLGKLIEDRRAVNEQGCLFQYDIQRETQNVINPGKAELAKLRREA